MSWTDCRPLLVAKAKHFQAVWPMDWVLDTLVRIMVSASAIRHS